MFENCKIGHVFAHISSSKACMAKRTAPFDSAHRIGLSTYLNDVLTVEGGVCGWRFKNCDIWDIFNYRSEERRVGKKRTLQSDSAHWIGPTPHFKDVLTVDKAVCGWRFKNCDILNVFNYCERSSACTAKRTTPSDSADRIGESTLLNDVLTVEEGVCGWRFKNCDIWDIFNYCERTSARTAKRTTLSNPADRIGESTLLNDVLTVEEGVCGWRFKNCDIWDVFNYCERTSAYTYKWTNPLDPADQIS